MDEREQIVAWLRSVKVEGEIEITSLHRAVCDAIIRKKLFCDQTALALDIADAIERGDHLDARP